MMSWPPPSPPGTPSLQTFLWSLLPVRLESVEYHAGTGLVGGGSLRGLRPLCPALGWGLGELTHPVPFGGSFVPLSPYIPLAPPPPSPVVPGHSTRSCLPEAATVHLATRSTTPGVRLTRSSPGSPFTSCVILGKSLNLSVPPFPHLIFPCYLEVQGYQITSRFWKGIGSPFIRPHCLLKSSASTLRESYPMF